MKLYQRLIAVAVSLTCLSSACMPVYAAGAKVREYEEDGYIHYDYTVETALTPEQAAQYQIYDVNPCSEAYTVSEDKFSVKDFVLSQCDLVEDELIRESSIQTYQSKTLSQYLFQCREIFEISVINGRLHLWYSCLSDGPFQLL